MLDPRAPAGLEIKATTLEAVPHLEPRGNVLEAPCGLQITGEHFITPASSTVTGALSQRSPAASVASNVGQRVAGHVRFMSSLTRDVHLSAHSITPYQEVYGVHPRLFQFSAAGMVASSLLRRGTYLTRSLHHLRMLRPLYLGTIFFWASYSLDVWLYEHMQHQYPGIRNFVGWPFRVLGALVIGRFGDMYGRRRCFNLGLSSMVLCSLGQGIVPGKSWGSEVRMVSFWMVCALRAVLEFLVSGEMTAVACFIFEMADPDSLGVSFAAIMLCIELGQDVAEFVCEHALTFINSDPDFMKNGGWRIPYICFGLLGLLILRGRLHLPDSYTFLFEVEGFEDRGFVPKVQKIVEAVRQYGLPVLLGFCVCGNYGAGAWIFPKARWRLFGDFYLADENEGAAEVHKSLQIHAHLCQKLIIPVAGFLCDVKGVAWMMLASGCVSVFFALPAYAMALMDPEDTFAARICALGFGVSLGLSSNMLFFCAELFPTRIRGVGLALTYCLHVSLQTALAEPIEAGLRRNVGNFGALLYFGLLNVASVAAVHIGLRLRHYGILELTHRRRVPYFGIEPAAASSSTSPVREPDAGNAEAGGKPQAGYEMESFHQAMEH